jgi:hypothetical protein
MAAAVDGVLLQSQGVAVARRRRSWCGEARSAGGQYCRPARFVDMAPASGRRASLIACHGRLPI